MSDKKIESWIKIIGAMVAVIGVFWGMVTYLDTRARDIETRRFESTQPFLERQLRLYTKAAQSTSILATSTDADERAAAEKTFWQLYWGELVMVEDRQVEGAMVAFGKALESGEPSETLEQLSLKLAKAIRRPLAASWQIEQWDVPDE